MKFNVASVLLLLGLAVSACNTTPSRDENVDSTTVVDSSILTDTMAKDTGGLDTSVIDTSRSDPQPKN